MVRALIGAVAGAIAMFIIGFIFFATPLQRLGTGTLDDSQAAAVQVALAANVPSTGTYHVPNGDTRAQSGMYSRGPIAVLHYNMGGFSIADPGVMVGGFVHMLIVTLVMAIALHRLSGSVTRFTDQMVLAGMAIVAIVLFERFGDPIWYHTDWTNAVYLFVADVVSLGTAAFVILKLLPRQAATPSA